jgi:hypothetical protein
MAEKKVVKFKKLIGFAEYETGRIRAVLEGVSEHYRLGDQPYLTTSLVVKVDSVTDADRNPQHNLRA